MLLKFALYILRKHLEGPQNYEPRIVAACKALRDHGLGNNNAKRREAAEAAITEFLK